jgi:tetratricopeptide (TPR) repeat protein
MRPGDKIDDRFEIDRLAGVGGMGKVFRARDERGSFVAIKVLHSDADEPRFAREAEVLATLRHPAIVQYLAHGATADGEPWLATEWLEGETLGDRLRRGRLSVEESLDLGVRVATALGAAHRIGVVHRDLKPSNVFLPGGEVARVKVLDFGIARMVGAASALTATGAILGTIGYMAPEQARGARDIDARADVFALGCVLFKCITGEPPFAGDDMLAVLLKVAVEEAPRLRDRRAGVPEELDALVAAMLAKPPDERPAEGHAAAAALAVILSALARRAGPPPSEPGRPRLTDAEQRVLSLVLAPGGSDSGPDAPTQPIAIDETRVKALRAAAERHQGQLDVLADGSVLITFPGGGAATDLAARAARCALAIRPLLGTAPIAVVSGRAAVSVGLPMGELIDRAVAMHRSASGADVEPIRIDETTARLLEAGFEMTHAGGVLGLRSERAEPDPARPLLGRPTACIGRERELGSLEALFAECAAEPVARAVLVTAEPGMGKSRLRHEFLRRLRARGEEIEIWTGRGDPMREGSSFGLLAEALRGAAGLSGAEPAASQRRALGARVARSVAPADAARVTELLAELVGAPFPDEEASAELRAARKDPLTLGDRMRRAWEAFLDAECARHPVVLVLEDLHWGDLPTVTYVDAALRGLRERPLFVIALGRPDVHALFPRLWAQAETQEIRLPKLTRRASERFARQVLGGTFSEAAVAWLVERADGNAFFLEELIRAAVEGRGDSLPDTVLSMVQARLLAMEPEARRVLRAASVFGMTFWRGGVTALLGDPDEAAWLGALMERELVTPPRVGRFPDEVEHDFRHAIVREAAYAMLVDADRAVAHRLAGEWLEARGEGDAMALAEHFERGGEPGRAAVFYRRAAEQALRGNDLAAAVARAERGLRAAAPSELRAALLSILLETHAWRNDWAAGAEHADEVFRREPPGSRPWCMAALVKVWAAPMLGRLDGFMEAVGPLAAVDPAPGAVSELAYALAAVVMVLTAGSVHDLAGVYLARMDQLAQGAFGGDLVALGWTSLARGYRLRQQDGDLGASLAAMRAARAHFEEAGNTHQVVFAEVHIALDCWLLGAHDEAARLSVDVLRGGPAGDTLPLVASLGKFVLANTLADQGRLDEARVEAEAMAAAEKQQKNLFFEGMARSTLAEILRRRGDLAGAEREALAAIELLAAIPFDQAIARRRLAAVRLAQGRAAEALGPARAALAAIEGAPGYAGTMIRLTHAEALAATGDEAGARAALVDARERLLARAATIGDATLRASFLQRVPDHAPLLARARGE